jgi:hypothetical protein
MIVSTVTRFSLLVGFDNMGLYHVVYSDDDFPDRFFRSAEDAHTALTREGFTVENPYWPDTWIKRPDSDLPNYVVRVSGEYVEAEHV